MRKRQRSFTNNQSQISYKIFFLQCKVINREVIRVSCPLRPIHRKRIAANLPKEDECRIWTIFNNKNIPYWLVPLLTMDTITHNNGGISSKETDWTAVRTHVILFVRGIDLLESSESRFICFTMLDLGVSERRQEIRHWKQRLWQLWKPLNSPN